MVHGARQARGLVRQVLVRARVACGAVVGSGESDVAHAIGEARGVGR